MALGDRVAGGGGEGQDLSPTNVGGKQLLPSSVCPSPGHRGEGQRGQSPTPQHRVNTRLPCCTTVRVTATTHA